MWISFYDCDQILLKCILWALKQNMLFANFLKSLPISNSFTKIRKLTQASVSIIKLNFKPKENKTEIPWYNFHVSLG